MGTTGKEGFEKQCKGRGQSVHRLCIQVVLERKVESESIGGANRVLESTPKALIDKDTRRAVSPKVKW